MKEEIGHLPGSSNLVCKCCRSPLSWREINQKDKERFYEYDGDKYKYSRSPKEYICGACVRDIKIETILLKNK